MNESHHAWTCHCHLLASDFTVTRSKQELILFAHFALVSWLMGRLIARTGLAPFSACRHPWAAICVSENNNSWSGSPVSGRNAKIHGHKLVWPICVSFFSDHHGVTERKWTKFKSWTRRFTEIHEVRFDSKSWIKWFDLLWFLSFNGNRWSGSDLI